MTGAGAVLPGEMAPSHHQTPAGLRLVVEGRGAYTAVEHQSLSPADPACLFHLSDEPAPTALGLWHEETRR